MKIPDQKRRLIYLGLFLGLFLLEVLIALFVHDSFIRPYGGDFLVVLLLCCLVRVIRPRGTQFLALYVFLFASAVEVGQYFDYASLLGLGDIRLFRILLGATFSPEDLVCYAVGCAVFFILENLSLAYIFRKKEC